MKRRLALAVVALAPLAVSAALGPRYGGVLRVGVPELPAAAPGVPRSAAERALSALLHETLVHSGPEGQPLPALAARWTSAASGREWVLELKEGAAFHDGAPVTADDAVRSLRRFLRSSSPAAARLARDLTGGSAFRARSSEDLPGLAARAPRRVTLRFDAARPLPLAPLAAPAAAIVGAGGAAAGPFAPTSVAAAHRAAFAAAALHVRGRPYLDRVEMVPVAAPAVSAELQAGRIDLAPALRDGPLSAVLLLVVDAGRPPFDKLAARQAVAAAVDRANLVRHLIPGGEPGAALLPPAVLAPLAGPGEPGAGLPLRAAVTMAVSREVPSLVSQRVVAHLADLGLQVAVDARAPARLLDPPAAALRLLLWSPEVPEPGLALHELASLAGAQADAEAALAAADAEPALDRRRALLYKAEAALRSSAAVVPLAAVPTGFRAVRRLQGVQVDAAGRIRIDDAWWEP